jgi:beta-lactamase regulating signal transducer with metallopeptidase domain
MILDRFIHVLGALLAVNLTKGLAVFLAAWMVTVVARRLRAEARHLIWFMVICSFLLLPLAWLALPAFQIGQRIPVEPGSAFRLAAAPALSRSDYMRLVDKSIEYATLARQGAVGLFRGLSCTLAVAWLAGVLWFAARYLISQRRLTRLTAGAQEARGLQPTLDALARELGYRGRVRLLCTARCAVPFAFGLRQPAILLPASAGAWPEHRLRAVLAHELGHIRRRDVLTQLIAYAICALFWGIPLLWMAYGFLVREAEKSCDRYVINLGIRGTRYARDIVDLARGCPRGHVLLPGTPIIMRRKNMLKERIENILRSMPARVTFRTRDAARVLAVCLCCIVPLLAVTCATSRAAAKPDDSLYEIWVNKEYEGRVDLSAKFVSYPTGKTLLYDHVSDSEPSYEGTYTITEAWTDSDGNHWCKVRWTNKDYPATPQAQEYKGFSLCRTNASGTVYEEVWSMAQYPTELSPIGGTYGIWHRQE